MLGLLGPLTLKSLYRNYRQHSRTLDFGWGAEEVPCSCVKMEPFVIDIELDKNLCKIGEKRQKDEWFHFHAATSIPSCF